MPPSVCPPVARQWCAEGSSSSCEEQQGGSGGGAATGNAGQHQGPLCWPAAQQRGCCTPQGGVVALLVDGLVGNSAVITKGQLPHSPANAQPQPHAGSLLAAFSLYSACYVCCPTRLLTGSRPCMALARWLLPVRATASWWASRQASLWAPCSTSQQILSTIIVISKAAHVTKHDATLLLTGPLGASHHGPRHHRPHSRQCC